MRSVRYAHLLLLFVALSLLVLTAGCRQEQTEQEATTIPPTPTSIQEPTATARAETNAFVTIATDAPYPPFAAFDEFGTVVGFDAELAESVLARAGYDYEFVVTNFEGMLQSVANGEFDMAISALTMAEPVEGVRYTEPYLEVGQVLVVLANEQELVTYRDISPEAQIGVVASSLAAERAALEGAGIAETNLQDYETVGQALQALINGEIRGVIIDHDDAEHYTRAHYEQLKIAGGSGRDAWITHQSYVIAVHGKNEKLLETLNETIAAAKADGTTERVTRNWLVSKETIDAGESLIGTPGDIIVIGLLGQLDSVDPAATPSAIGWEVKYNTMSGLYIFDADDNLVPALASGPPEISDDKLEYTFTLRSDLTFPDGSPLTAEDVRWSINRAASLGNWHVNAFLKDSDGDAIADPDAVQVVSPTVVKFVLKQPAPYFPNLLATPPYFIVSQNCYASQADPARNCNGIGPYEIIEWEAGEFIQLQANPQWFGSRKPTFENIQLRFYEDSERLKNAVELNAVDIAWGNLSDSVTEQLSALPNVRTWEGTPTFKSYLVFQQEDTPWQSAPVRQAAAYAIDREALAQQVFKGRRQPLYSPIPADVPGHIPAEPQRDLERARELLRLAGYSTDNPVTVPLWYLNDGRYTPLEEAYAQAIEQQLEETGMIQVELNGAAWETYGVEMSECTYATFLLGWPPVGWPTRYPAAMGWLDYFITNTDSLCSNYESATMNSLVEQLRRLDPSDTAGQLELYRQIQELWAQEFPTLDLTQESPRIVASEAIGNVKLDHMGLLRYLTLTKEAGEN